MIQAVTRRRTATGHHEKQLQILSKMMRAAVQAGLLFKSPCDGVELPRIERVEMRFLDATEVRALSGAIDPRYKADVPLAAFGGLRAGELFRAKFSFNAARNQIRSRT